MKSKFFKMVVVAASAMALMNCGDAADAAANAVADAGQKVETPTDPSVPSDLSVPGDPSVPSDPTALQPVIDPETGLPVIDPITGEPIMMPVVDPIIGEPIESSSDSVDPSAPSEQPIESSSSVDDSRNQYCNANPTASICGNMDVIPMPDEGKSSSSETVESSSSSSETVEPASSSSVAAQPAPKGIFLSNDTDENKNYMEVEYFTKTGDNGGAVLAYPKRLSETQKHGVVLWGPGGGTEPTAYEGLIKRLASHGFVVIATSESPDGTGRGKPALDWLEKKNNTPGDPLYQKLDMTKVGASGHSMGGLQSEEMLIADDRVITAILNNSGDMGHSDATRIPATKTFAIVYGEGGMERPNAEGDYNNPGVKAPGCLIKMSGGQGNECQQGECGWGHGSGPWGGMAATVAWMRWHLGGEDFRKADFVGSTGRYIDGAIIGQQGHWKGQCKNF